MLRRPQRTEAAQRLEARTARTLGLPLLRGLGGEQTSGPARSQAEAACGWSASTGRTAAVVFAATAQRERYAAARRVRAVQVSQSSSYEHLQSACEHRPPLQCELSSCQRLWPALTPRREWRPPKAGGWGRPGRQLALLHAARQATEKCARRRHVRNDRAMAVLDNYMSSGIMQSDARRLSLT